jgi:hypothetical protein
MATSHKIVGYVSRVGFDVNLIAITNVPKDEHGRGVILELPAYNMNMKAHRRMLGPTSEWLSETKARNIDNKAVTLFKHEEPHIEELISKMPLKERF